MNPRLSHYRFGIMLVLVIAAAMRIAPVFTSLPYLDYIDEGYILHQSIEVLRHRSLDTRWYVYPPFPAYLTTAATLTYSPFYHLRTGHSLRHDLPRDKELHTPEGDNYELITPPDLIAVGRLVVVFLGLATVIVTGFLGQSLFDRRVATLAMFTVATCPALVRRSSIVIIDSFTTFFAILTAYLSILTVKETRRGTASALSFCAGVAGGLAFASKYTLFVCFGGVLIATTFHPERSLRKRTTIAAVAGATVGGAIGSPLLLLMPIQVLKALEFTVGFYGTLKSSPGYIGQAFQTAELGPLLILTGFIGIAWMLRGEKTRIFAVGWLILTAGLFVLVGFRTFQPFRNLLPVVPGLCLASASALIKAYDSLQTVRYRAAGRLAVGLIIAASMLTLSMVSCGAIRDRMSVQDTRIKVVNWLREHIGQNQRVLALSELGFVPNELASVGVVRVASLPKALRLLRQSSFDYVISTQFAEVPNASDAKSEQIKEWHLATRQLPVVAKFGAVRPPIQPYIWRTNDELILVLKGAVQPEDR